MRRLRDPMPFDPGVNAETTGTAVSGNLGSRDNFFSRSHPYFLSVCDAHSLLPS